MNLIQTELKNGLDLKTKTKVNKEFFAFKDAFELVDPQALETSQVDSYMSQLS